MNRKLLGEQGSQGYALSFSYFNLEYFPLSINTQQKGKKGKYQHTQNANTISLRKFRAKQNTMAGLQYYFFPTDFYYPRPPKINGNNNKNIFTDDVAAAAPASVGGGVLETPPATGAALDRRDMLFQDKILKVSTPLSMKFVRYQPVLVRRTAHNY